MDGDTVYYPSPEIIFATYEWDDELKVPVFTFNKDNTHVSESFVENQEIWLSGIESEKEWLPDMNATVLG